MLLRQMKYFTTVVQCGSFTEAAGICYISQSAISQQIQTLEADLGVELIKRRNRRFSLTPAGEYFYQQSLILLNETEKLRRETVRIAGQAHPLFRVGYLHGYSGPQLQQALALFAARYADLDIRVIHGTHEELYDKLRHDEADLVFSDQRRALSEAYVNFHIFTDYCYVEVSACGPFADASCVTMAQLRHTPCILVTSEAQQEIERDHYQNTLGFTGSFIFVSSLEEGRLLVAGNRGFMPLQGGAPLLAQKETMIRRIPLCRDEVQVKRNYYAFWKKEKDEPQLQVFAQILRNQFTTGEDYR